MVFQITVVLLVLAIGLAIGFMKGLRLPEEKRRSAKKTLFELKELPRRFFV